MPNEAARRYRMSVLRWIASGITAAVLLAPGEASTGDAVAGREKALRCQACHGLDGIGKMPDVPHIAGESEFYLTKQLKGFRSGERTHEQMSIIAQSLSDEDIADLSTYYSSIEFTVKPPQ